MDENTKVIVDDIRAGIKAYEDKAGNLEKTVDGLNAELFDVKQKMASMSIVNPVNNKAAYAAQLASMLLEKKEVRNAATGLGQNGTGNIQTVAEIVRGMVDKNKLAKLTRQFWGDNAQIPIPVFLPGMARPSGAVESDSGKSMDSTAALAAVTLTPYEFFAGLEVSRLALYTTALENSIADIFDDAFGQAWEYQILNGTGSYQFTGIFNSTWITSVNAFSADQVQTAASATAVTWKELAKLARSIRAKAQGSEKLALICHPDVISSVITATGASPALEMEYFTKGTIGGVQVIESTFAPNTMTTGKYVAAAVDLNKYATAWVRDFTIEPIKAKGTSNVYEQGFIYANGQPLDKSSFFYLKLA